jgi:hypothetical protein
MKESCIVRVGKVFSTLIIRCRRVWIGGILKCERPNTIIVYNNALLAKRVILKFWRDVALSANNTTQYVRVLG